MAMTIMFNDFSNHYNRSSLNSEFFLQHPVNTQTKLVWYQWVLYHAILYHIISYHSISYHITAHIKSYHITYQIISYNIPNHIIIMYHIIYHHIIILYHNIPPDHILVGGLEHFSIYWEFHYLN
jgi:hypothetical protein